MGSRQDKQPASLPQLLKEKDEIMLLWNVFWRGLGIKPISFYLKQCAVCLQFNKHTLARIVLRFPSLFNWLARDILASFRHFTVRGSVKVIPKVICLSSGTCRFSPKAIELAKPRGWRLSMDVPWAYSSSDTRAGVSINTSYSSNSSYCNRTRTVNSNCSSGSCFTWSTSLVLFQ